MIAHGVPVALQRLAAERDVALQNEYFARATRLPFSTGAKFDQRGLVPGGGVDGEGPLQGARDGAPGQFPNLEDMGHGTARCRGSALGRDTASDCTFHNYTAAKCS